MDKIDKLLVKTAQKDVRTLPPIHFTNAIHAALKKREATQWKINLRKLTTVITAILIVCFISVSVYASLGGKLFGKPIIEWLGIKFSDEYENYVVVEDQTIQDGENKISLVAKMCDDGFTVLEFDLTLTDEILEKLQLEERKLIIKDGVFGVTQESCLRVSFNNKVIEEDGKTLVEGLNNYNVIIDGQNYWVRPRAPQQVIEVSKNTYKIYQMYFLTEKELNNKKEFTIELNNITVCGYGENYFPIEGNFKIKLSKKDAMNNSKVINPNCQAVKFKNMTKTIDKVTITPLQTIVKLKSNIDNISYESLGNVRHKDHIGVIQQYDVYDQNENKLTSQSYEVQRTLIYADGTIQNWEVGDIGGYFRNRATMILTEYIIIEKKESIESLKIVPYIMQPNENGEEQKVEMDSFHIEI